MRRESKSAKLWSENHCQNEKLAHARTTASLCFVAEATLISKLAATIVPEVKANTCHHDIPKLKHTGAYGMQTQMTPNESNTDNHPHKHVWATLALAAFSALALALATFRAIPGLINNVDALTGSCGWLWNIVKQCPSVPYFTARTKWSPPQLKHSMDLPWKQKNKHEREWKLVQSFTRATKFTL